MKYIWSWCIAAYQKPNNSRGGNFVKSLFNSFNIPPYFIENSWEILLKVFTQVTLCPLLLNLSFELSRNVFVVCTTELLIGLLIRVHNYIESIHVACGCINSADWLHLKGDCFHYLVQGREALDFGQQDVGVQEDIQWRYHSDGRNFTE